MSISTATMSMDNVSAAITQGIANQLEVLIREKLQVIADEVVSQVARDLADRTSAAVHTMHAPVSPNDVWGPKIVVHLVFNGKDIVYTTEKVEH